MEKAKENVHQHKRILGNKTELYFAMLCGVFLVAAFLIEKFSALPNWVSLTGYCVSYFFGGYFITIEASKKIIKGGFDIDFLMIAAAAGAAYIGSWAEGSLLLFLFSLGHALEHYAMNKAKKSIEALNDLSPKIALVKNEGKLKEVAISELKIGDVIIVKSNTKIAADGVIISGSSSINQAPITGESMPVDKTFIKTTFNLPEFTQIDKKHIVFTGTINGDSNLEVLVLKLSKDSSVSRLIKMVSEVETQKSPTQRLTKKFEKWYVPLVIIMVFLLCFAYLVIDENFNASLYRAITVLVAASPCALAISTPSAVLSGIARAAQKGVLIKGGKALEDLGEITTMAFDKTGTLTEGKPKLTNVIPINNFDEKELIRIVLEVESLSNHPLAKAIAKDIETKYKVEAQNKAVNVNAIQGKGIQAQYNGDSVFIGNVKLMEDKGIMVVEAITNKMKDLLDVGQTVMIVAYRSEIIGLISVMDLPRETAAKTLQQLKDIGIKHMDHTDAETASEVIYLVKALCLKPQCVISYHRRAYEGSRYDHGLRITFDTHLKYRLNELDITTLCKDRFFLPPDRVVMEIKANERVPNWLTSLVGFHECSLQRISKYCIGVEAGESFFRQSRALSYNK